MRRMGREKRAQQPIAVLHRFSWGLAVLFLGILMGVQSGRIFLTGEWYSVPVRQKIAIGAGRNGRTVTLDQGQGSK